jgi:hypothetical protein
MIVLPDSQKSKTLYAARLYPAARFYPAAHFYPATYYSSTLYSTLNTIFGLVVISCYLLKVQYGLLEHPQFGPALLYLSLSHLPNIYLALKLSLVLVLDLFPFFDLRKFDLN